MRHERETPRVWPGEAAGAMLTFLFAVWSCARALRRACERRSAGPEDPEEDIPPLPRLRSARASSDLSSLSAATTTTSTSSSGDRPKRLRYTHYCQLAYTTRHAINFSILILCQVREVTSLYLLIIDNKNNYDTGISVFLHKVLISFV